MRWDIVTFSLGYGIDPSSIDEDIRHFRNVNFPDTAEILVVNDASEDVGSGGSALNALIRTAECLCHRKNYTVLTEAVLQNVNVLIVLVSDPRAILNGQSCIDGGNGYVFCTFLAKSIHNAGEVAERARQKGVWIIGTDASWNLDKQPKMFDLPQNSITGFSSYTYKLVPLEGHGYYSVNSENDLVGMEFDGEVSGTKPAETNEPLLILGFVYLPFKVATSLLSLYSEYPVAASTYLGVDSNVTPLKLSLFFDFLLATCTNETDFVTNKLGVRGKVSENVKDRSTARMQIHRKLSGHKGSIEILDISCFKYKEFPSAQKSYIDILEKAPVEEQDLERSLRTGFSIQSVLGFDTKASISQMLTVFRNNIQKSESPEMTLHLIFSASLALSLASNGKGGLRNGPAKNPIFEKILNEKKDCLVSIIDEIRENWTSDPSKMVRAARHLETAAQKLIREMVDDMCASRILKLLKLDGTSPNSARVSAPVRIDFFGGWLDTPPIFFEMDDSMAAVINMAVQLDGKNPISCHITKSSAPTIELIQDGISIHIESDEDLIYMHDKPSETGALVCACVVSLGFRDLPSLFETLQCTGLRIETRSDLPHGSGLGTSSIMACTILKAICALGQASEEMFTLEDQIAHTVLKVEQIMTTGGGWQDQFGAMYPGLKKCYYQKRQGILYKPIPLSPHVKSLLEERLLLVYTGKTRLAKNLLQEVIRNFSTCVKTRRTLSRMAREVDEFSKRIEKGDIAVELLEQYHETKKFMTRCEPQIVTELLETLKGQSMISVGWAAGAGGGGFLYLWLSEHTTPESVKTFLATHPDFCQMTCHRISIPLVPPVTLELN